MYGNKLFTRSFTAVASALMIGSASVTFSQTPSPSPTPERDYTLSASVEFGARGLDVNGDDNKYRSDLNYRAGFRLFDSTFLLETKRPERLGFDSLLVTASGWGSDPTGSFRLNAGRNGGYNFDANVRRVRYFNHINKNAINESTFDGQHNFNTLHHFGDLDLTVFPESPDFRLKLGYSFNNTEGPGSSTLRFRSDQFVVDSTIKTRSDDFRGGVEGKLLGFDLGFNYGHRNFRDRTSLFVNSLNLGNQTAANTSSINKLIRAYPTKGTTDFAQFFIHRTFADRLDLTGRFIYAESNSEFNQNDIIQGLNSGTPNNIVTLDQIAVTGNAKRPQTRADLGLTYLIGKRFRISNTFGFDQFNIGAGNTFFELLRQTTSTGGSVADSITRSLANRLTAYRRFSDTIEGDYQVNNRLAFNIGYRYTHRRVVVNGFDTNLITGVSTSSGNEELENTTHSVIAGVKVKPTKNWSIFADAERGESDNVFTRLANNDFVNFRVRSIAHVKRFSFNMSGIVKNNDSPGRTIQASTGSGSTTIVVPPFESVAVQRSRNFSTSVDWEASDKVSIGAGYTYNYLDSRADVIVPVGAPLFTTTRFLQGVSEFYIRDSFFHFDVSVRPVKWVSAFVSYRIDDDRGQGDRTITRPQDLITSFPMKYQTPEVRLAFRLHRNVDWNVGYQYYDYKEKPVVLSFVPLPFIAQNYNAHMPYTSLRIYLGKAADR